MGSIEITSIEYYGIKVLEPVTTLTDLLVSAVCFYAFAKLRHHPHPRFLSLIYYRYFFLMMGLATLLGGIIGHGFLYLFSFEWKVPAWIVSMLSVALAERAAIIRAKPLLQKNVGRLWGYINIIELLTFMFISIYTLKFIFVEIHAIYGLLIVVFSFESYIFVRTRDVGSQKIMRAVLLAALAASCHIGKISIDKWFNYFDLAHCFMAWSCWELYRAVLYMKPEFDKRDRI